MLVIGNGRLVTRDPEQPFFENEAVTMDDITIKRVGILEEIKKEFHNVKYMDIKGGIITPASIDIHGHIYSAMTRGLSIRGYDPKGFLDILDGMWWAIDHHLTGGQTRQSAGATYLDSIKDGVTTVFDHHASFGEIKDSLFAVEDVAKEIGVRTCLCYEISDRDGMDKTRTTIMENASWTKHALTDDTGMIAGMMEMHAQFTVSDETIELVAANKPAEVGYHIHVAEGIEDLHDCLKRYGKRIVDHLMDCDIPGEETLLARCIYVNPHEMQLIKDTDTMVVHNPESNMGNAYGCLPTVEIVYRGVPAGLGTDSYTHDMTESFKVANVLHKHYLCGANAAWDEIPQMLLKGNAKIANHYFRERLDVLKEGTAADVIVIGYIPLTPMDVSNINGHVLFGIAGRSTVTTVCNGRVLMKDRELVGPSEEKILYEVREEAKKLAYSVND